MHFLFHWLIFHSPWLMHLPHASSKSTVVICQPWSPSLAASHCVIDRLLYWWLATRPTTTRKPVQGHPLENAHRPHPPHHHHSICRLLPSIRPYILYIHPSLRSPTPASHASALTSLINQGLSQSAVWAAVHFDHLLLLTLSTFLI